MVRFRMPDEAVVFDDLVRGEVRFEPENVPDFVLARADGSPLYPLTNPVDDAVMGITHVLRGDDLLPSTPRQIPLHAALRSLGVASGPMPRFGHLPMVLGEARQRLSKRKTPEASLLTMRAEGYLPEGILNYLALLGWSLGGDRELFTLAEMVAEFDVARISRNPAVFDVKKLGRDQRGQDPGAGAVRVRQAAAAVPGPARAARLARHRRAARPRGGGGAAGAGAGGDAGRGGGPARVPARPRPPLHRRPGRGGQGAHRRRLAGPCRRCGRADRAAGLERGVHPGGAAGVRWWRVSASSRASRTGRSGSRSPGSTCRRRCSSRSNCSGGTARWTGCVPPGPVWGPLPAWASIDTRHAGQVGVLIGVWGNWQPDGFWFR